MPDNTLPRTLAVSLALATALVGAPRGQDPGADRSTTELSLEAKLELALINNPEIQVAQAKIHQAEAEYRIVRLKVTQQVLQNHASLASQRRIIEAGRKELERTTLLHRNGNISSAELGKASNKLIQAQNEVAQLSAQAQFLLGRDPAGKGPASSLAKSPATARPPIPQKFADALQMQVKLSFENQPITEIIKTFSGRIADSFDESNRMVFVVDTESLEAEMGLLEDVPLTFHNGTMDLQHALQVIADTTPFRFVFRDYGILVTTMSRIALIRAATIPADMPLARDR